MIVQNRTRHCYDTTLIYLFIKGKEHLLPQQLIDEIPYSTRATWKTYTTEKFIGYAQQKFLDEGVRQIELYRKYKHIKKILSVVIAIYTSVSAMLDMVKIPLYQIKANKERVLDLIAQYKNTINLQTLLQIFKLSQSTYQSWLLQIKIKCSSSYFEQCVRRYGTQLTKNQLHILQDALLCDKLKHWPISSIAYYYQRNNTLHATANTWYKYARLLGIKRKWKRRAKKYESIPCTRPNEYWHVDITYFTTRDNVKHCIYFLSDNFSRKILAWRLASNVSWVYVKECIEDAYKIAVKMESALNLQIISDGGPENTHHALNDYIEGLIGNIKKKIALKDITFSNSPAETKNRTFKTYYVDGTIENEPQLRNRIIFYVDDINYVRPSGVLKGYTPTEVYRNTKPDYDFAMQRKIDAAKRKIANQNNSCGKCEGLL